MAFALMVATPRTMPTTRWSMLVRSFVALFLTASAALPALGVANSWKAVRLPRLGFESNPWSGRYLFFQITKPASLFRTAGGRSELIT